jgi:hypothetical protein
MSNVTKQLKSYPYQQYTDDPNIAAFFDAYNNTSQQNLDWMNGIYLPIYSTKYGELLNLVGLGIYGVQHADVSYGGYSYVGEINTAMMNQAEINGAIRIPAEVSLIPVDDEAYKRIIQWNTFQGDGRTFSVTWLKRRVARFLTGVTFLEQTYGVSVKIDASSNFITIIINPSEIDATYFDVLQAGIFCSALQMPPEYIISVKND